MPAKGKRVAARQAQLNRRRRRQARPGGEEEGQAAVSSGGTATASVAPPVVAVAPADSGDDGASEANAQAAPAAPRATVNAAAAGQYRPAQGLAYTHLARELRRILILAGIVLAVLIGVSFVF